MNAGVCLISRVSTSDYTGMAQNMRIEFSPMFLIVPGQLGSLNFPTSPSLLDKKQSPSHPYQDSYIGRVWYSDPWETVTVEGTTTLHISTSALSFATRLRNLG